MVFLLVVLLLAGNVCCGPPEGETTKTNTGFHASNDSEPTIAYRDAQRQHDRITGSKDDSTKENLYSSSAPTLPQRIHGTDGSVYQEHASVRLPYASGSSSGTPSQRTSHGEVVISLDDTSAHVLPSSARLFFTVPRTPGHDGEKNLAGSEPPLGGMKITPVGNFSEHFAPTFANTVSQTVTDEATNFDTQMKRSSTESSRTTKAGSVAQNLSRKEASVTRKGSASIHSNQLGNSEFVSSGRKDLADEPAVLPDPNEYLPSAEDIIKRWKQLEKAWKIKTDSVLRKALPKIFQYRSRVNVSSQCNYALMQLVSGLRNLKSWAVRMIDASGSLPSGSLEGTFTDFGDYDQCLDIAHRIRKGHIQQLKGQYCTLEIKPLLPALKGKATLHTKVLDFGNASSDSVLSDLSHSSALFHIMVLRIGVCTPSLCSETDIRSLARLAVRKLPVEVSVRNCEVRAPVRLTTKQFIILSFAVIVLLLLLSGTVVDVYYKRAAIKPSDIGRLKLSIMAFSFPSNIRQLMKSSNKANSLSAVNGIRCLSLVWIVLAHTYGFGHRQGLAHLSHARRYMEDIPFQIITNAWVSVDTFFMLGGLLVSASNLRSFEENDGKMNFVHYVLHRIWRLTPPVAATVGIMFLLPLIGSGPLWDDMIGQKVKNCETGWWQALLPINTWLDFDSACLLHTWYVAADIHFYCLAPLVLISLYKWPLIGFMLLFLMAFIAALVTGFMTFFHNLPPTVIFFSPDVEMTKKTANLIYFRPYPHMGAYCVGLVLGYLLWKHKKISVNWVTQSLGWMLSVTSCLAVLFASYPWSKGQTANQASCIAYAMTHRTVWACGVAWVIFICATGRGGVLNQFLSSHFFLPLSRLCYSVYLLHFPVLWVRVSWRRSLLNFHHYDVVTEFFGILVITLLLSIPFYATFEAPFLKLEQIWFPRTKRQLPKNKPEEKYTT